MATYTSFDPRKSIREKIGTSILDVDKGDLYVLKVSDSTGGTEKIPMYLSEEVKSETLAEMPFLDMHMASTTYEPHDIGAATRKHDCYIDVGLWFADTDNVDRTDFGKKVCDKIIDKVRTNQCDFTGITFINVEEVREIKEEKAHQVIYHFVIVIYCLYYDI